MRLCASRRSILAARAAASFGLLIVFGAPALFLAAGDRPVVILVGIAYFMALPIVDELLLRRLARAEP